MHSSNFIRILGQSLSGLTCHTQGMKNSKTVKLPTPPDLTIGQFGNVRLLRDRNGKHYVAGGSEMERRIVKNWCKRLAPFLDFKEPCNEERVLTE
jgi:hypothetical protein